MRSISAPFTTPVTVTARPLAALLIVVAALLLGPAASAQVLRWASQGDALTMDPHSQNEDLANNLNAQVYERLTRRDRQLAIVPGLATEWQQTAPTSSSAWTSCATSCCTAG
ncbi:MAG TPA: hypothetical protein PK306_06920 [Aquabacterium sp.]|nr:hypothetical protein [Aquabacterium sp.]HQC95424.1 hypothetical protein [Aquabacterium sp.]